MQVAESTPYQPEVGRHLVSVTKQQRPENIQNAISPPTFSSRSYNEVVTSPQAAECSGHKSIQENLDH